MRITQELSDDAVLAEWGERVQRHRLDRNITQAALAHAAGVSTPTVQRLESGASVQLTSLLRILRALDLLEGGEALIPPPGVRPMQLPESKGKQRQRASGRGEEAPCQPWTWGD